MVSHGKELTRFGKVTLRSTKIHLKVSWMNEGGGGVWVVSILNISADLNFV